MTASIHADTRAYEAWLKAQGPVVDRDLELKHSQMAESLFPFLRATFYRWCRLWPEFCPTLTTAPTLLAVGDLHVENFGTWRDAEGRLVWGINDLDEAQVMPYALDLVRLATSALIALDDHGLSAEEVAGAILEGYGDGLAGGRPFVLEEDHGWLRELALGELRDPERFWKKLNDLKAADPDPGAEVRAILAAHLPAGAELHRIAPRVAGLGSLGRRRFVAVATSGGAAVASEVKTLCPSAWSWVQGTAAAPIRCGDLVTTAIRCPDPFLAYQLSQDRLSGWVVRRLAPHCCRVELATLPHRREDRHLLRAMGRETANVHWGSGPSAIGLVRADLNHRPAHWLRHAAEAMAEATRADWKAWRS
jgi:hypothetical protein